MHWGFAAEVRPRAVHGAVGTRSQAGTGGPRVGSKAVMQDAGVIEIELGTKPSVSQGVRLGETQTALPLLDSERMGFGPVVLAAELPGFEVNSVGVVPGRVIPVLEILLFLLTHTAIPN